MEEQEKEWLSKAQSGDRKASDRLLWLYAPVVYRYFRCVLRHDKQQTEDLVQKAFMEIWNSLPGFQGKSSLKTWILRICQRVVARYYRKQSTKPQSFVTEEGLESHDFNQEELLMSKESYDMLSRLLDGLPPLMREVLYLYYLQELPVGEISQLIEVPPGTVKSRLFKAREELRTRWERHQEYGTKK